MPAFSGEPRAGGVVVRLDEVEIDDLCQQPRRDAAQPVSKRFVVRVEWGAVTPLAMLAQQ